MIKTEIDLAEVEKHYKLRKFKNLEVQQRISDGFINLSYLMKFINTMNKTKFSIYQYLSSKSFYLDLLNIDNSLTNKSNVYLLHFPKENTFKIGKTFDIKQRYPTDVIENNLIDISPVINDASVEKELIEYFTQKYEVVKGTNETFYLTCKIETIKTQFRSIIQKHLVKPEKINSKLLIFPNPRADDRTIYGHVEVAHIFTNHFSTGAVSRKNWDYLFLKISHEIPNSTLDFVENIENKSTCLYWYFNGYVIIKDINDNFFNASRLVNSVSKSDGKKKSFIDLMAKKFFKDLCDQYRLYTGGKEPVKKVTNKTQPALNGWWVHEYLIETVMRWLKPEYELLTNIFITESKKIISDTSLSSDEKIKQIQDLMLLTILNNKIGKLFIMDEEKIKIEEMFNNISKIRELEVNIRNLIFI